MRSNVAPVVVARIRSLPCVAATAAVAAAWLYGPGGGRFKRELGGKNCMSQVLNLDFQQTSLGYLFLGGGLGNEETQSISHIFTQAAHVDMILGWIPLLRLGDLPFQLSDVAV